MMELEHCLNTIEFLHGCLTGPAHFKYAHPKLTIKRIKRPRKIVGPRNYCHHSHVEPACPQCHEGVQNRAIAFRVCRRRKNENHQIICLDHDVVAIGACLTEAAFPRPRRPASPDRYRPPKTGNSPRMCICAGGLAGFVLTDALAEDC
jgi:hypothetical protein